MLAAVRLPTSPSSNLLFLFSPPTNPPLWVVHRDSGADDDEDDGVTVEASDVDVVVVAAEAEEVSIPLLLSVH